MRARYLIAACVLVVAGCALQDDENRDVAALHAAFPDHAERVLGDAGNPVGVDGDSYVSAIAQSVVRLPREAGGAISFELAGGFTVEVRETAIVGAGVAEAGHVRYARHDGVVYWSAVDGAIEEWLHVRSPAPGVIAEYEVLGGRLEQRDAVVAILDDDGRERVRVSAPEAFGSSGAAIGVALEVDAERARIRLVVDAAAGAEREILVDPLWSVVSTMSAARRLHTATLLPDGKVLVAGGYEAGVLSACETWDPRTGRWSAAPAMQVARYEHAAVLLVDGTILVSGGRDAAGTPIAASERYNPVTNTWTIVAPMTTPRAGHTLTLLRSGRVLAVGNATTAELYDSVSTTWNATGSPHVGRNDHTATRLHNGRVLIVGGRNLNGYLPSTEIYNDITGSFAFGPAMPGPRASHTATLMRDGHVLVTGGRSAATSYLASAYRYDPTAGFVATGALAAPRAHHTATLLPDNRVLVVGGYNAAGGMTTEETFTPAINTWASAPAIAWGIYQHTAVLLHEGRVLIAGGLAGHASPSAFVENPAFGHDTWSAAGQLPWNFTGTGTQLPGGATLLVGNMYQQPLAPSYGAAVLGSTGSPIATGPLAYHSMGHAATLMLDERVFVAGGLRFTWSGGYYTNQGATTEAQVYDIATNTWHSVAPMQHPRAYATATVLPSGKILVVGGIGPDYNPPSNGLGNWLPPSELYDPVTNTWTQLSGSQGRYGHTATLTASGKVVVVGGSTYYDYDGYFQVPSAELDVYDPQVGFFVAYAMGTGRCQHTATSLPDGRILVTGGSASCEGLGATFTSTEVIDPIALTATPAGNLQAGRMRHTATLLANGMVMITGGSDWSVPFVPTTELFDPATGLMSTSPGIPDHPAVLIPTLLQYDGKVAQLGWMYPDNLSPDQNPREIWRYDEGRRATSPPLVNTAPTTADPGDLLVVTGQTWAAAESTENAATDQPRLILIRHESQTHVVAPLRSFAVGTATFQLPPTTLRGWYQARIVINGIPSLAWSLKVE